MRIRTIKGANHALLQFILVGLNVLLDRERAFREVDNLDTILFLDTLSVELSCVVPPLFRVVLEDAQLPEVFKDNISARDWSVTIRIGGTVPPTTQTKIVDDCPVGLHTFQAPKLDVPL